jgi:hypothetical protein
MPSLGLIGDEMNNKGQKSYKQKKSGPKLVFALILVQTLAWSQSVFSLMLAHALMKVIA